MTKWIERQVSDLEAGNYVQAYGEVLSVKPYATPFEIKLEIKGFHVCCYWPAHAKVLVKDQPKVKILPISTNAGSWRVLTWNQEREGSDWCADFRKKDHAEFFAEQLRNGTVEP